MNLHELVSRLIVDTKGSAAGTGVTIDSSLGAFAPELILCLTAMLALLVRVFRFGQKVPTAAIVFAGAVLALVSAHWSLVFKASGPTDPAAVTRMEIFTGMLVHDQFSVFVRSLLLVFLALFVVFTKLSGVPDDEDAPDIYTLAIGSTLGMCMMASANHLMMVFMAVEMASVPSYALAGQMKGRRQGSEAALKYSVYGAGAAGVMLYGISLLAGLLNTAHLPTMATEIARRMADFGSGEVMVLALGALMLGVGLAFKLSAVPFHFWCPDVFEGATAEVDAFLSVASKAAALALLVRVAIGFGMPAPDGVAPGGRTAAVQAAKLRAAETADDPAPTNASFVSKTSDEPVLAKAPARDAIVQRLSPVRHFAAQLIGLVAAVTCTFGNFAAYGQTNIKRLLAYSTIAHAGYMMMAVAAATAVAGIDHKSAEWSIAALGVYLFTYLFMNLGAFVVVAFLRNALRSEELADYSGLIRRFPTLAVCFAIMLFALIGLPPFSGFLGKLHVFGGVVDAYQRLSAAGISSGWLLALVIVGGLNTAVSLFYYLRVIKLMIIDDEPRDRSPIVQRTVWLETAFVLLLTAPTVALILNWNWVVGWTNSAAQQMFR